MIVLKCKMCGGDLHPEEGAVTCECEFCGTLQTIPSDDSEKKTNLFNRANRLRINAEFDKAASVYESIAAEFPEEAEAYWGLCLCAYGIEYVDDPGTSEKKPTCHRTLPTSIMEDPNFEQACDNADPIARRVYREEAKAIDQIQRDILSIVSSEEPYDVFICYKETAEEGGRTEDSVLAEEIYDVLTGKGLKVFFARITLEDKLGQQYEPYIYAALSSAKVMLAIGTKFEYYDAVWVKNEWMRFLSMMKTHKDKTLIPCYKGLDAYDMPKEFKNLQAQDMGKLGWLQDLSRGIIKLCEKEVNKPNATSSTQVQSVNNLLKRAEIFIQDGEKEKAVEYINKVLDLSPECSRAFFLRLLIKHDYQDDEQLIDSSVDFIHDKDYARAKQFASIEEKKLFQRIERLKNATDYRRVGSIVSFGKYPINKLISVCEGLSIKQERHEINEKINWIVADTNKEKSLLICQSGIERKAFHELENTGYEDDSYVSWEDSSIRKWLNTIFWNKAFTAKEKLAVSETNVENGDEQSYQWEEKWKSCETALTKDKVFLLSYAEVMKYFPESKDRICHMRDENNSHSSYSWWWIRSPAEDNIDKCAIDGDGELILNAIDDELIMVRPAIWINLDSSFFDTPIVEEISEEEKIKNRIRQDLEKKNIELEKQIIKQSEDMRATREQNKNDEIKKSAIEELELAQSHFDIERIIDQLYRIKDYEGVEQIIQQCEIKNKLMKEIENENNELLKKYNANTSDYLFKKEKEEQRKRENQFRIKQLQEMLMSYKNEEANLRGLFVGKKKKELQIKICSLSSEIEKIKEEEQPDQVMRPSPDNAISAAPDKDELYYKMAMNYYKGGLYLNAYRLFCSVKGYNDVDNLLKNDSHISNIRSKIQGSLKTKGSTVLFGHYPFRSKDDMSSIEWRVVAIHDNMCLLVSKYIIDALCYDNSEKAVVTWDQCTLRSWLNRDFYELAFDSENKDVIVATGIKNENGGHYYETQEKVFIFSSEEATNLYFHDDDNSGFGEVCYPTPYACSRGWFNKFSFNSTDAVPWWLRETSNAEGEGKDICANGDLENRDKEWEIGVRPAIWIDTHILAP